eukprot:15464854-Alexandrium_andersonii.AAC.1
MPRRAARRRPGSAHGLTTRGPLVEHRLQQQVQGGGTATPARGEGAGVVQTSAPLADGQPAARARLAQLAEAKGE